MVLTVVSTLNALHHITHNHVQAYNTHSVAETHWIDTTWLDVVRADHQGQLLLKNANSDAKSLFLPRKEALI